MPRSVSSQSHDLLQTWCRGSSRTWRRRSATRWRWTTPPRRLRTTTRQRRRCTAAAAAAAAATRWTRSTTRSTWASRSSSPWRSRMGRAPRPPTRVVTTTGGRTACRPTRSSGRRSRTPAPDSLCANQVSRWPHKQAKGRHGKWRRESPRIAANRRKLTAPPVENCAFDDVSDSATLRWF